MDRRGPRSTGAEKWNSRSAGVRREWEEPAQANTALLAGLPYFPFRFDTPEPLMLALIGAAFLMIAWRFCRRN